MEILKIKISSVIYKTIKNEFLNKDLIDDITYFVIKMLFKYKICENEKNIKFLVKYFFND